jgi:hypothetical protein
MTDLYVFLASGDACPICASLDGQVVDGPGYTPHEGCMCQTVLQGQQGDCEWDYTESGRAYIGLGWADVIIGIAVEVRCPDGAVFAAETQFDGSAFGADFSDESIDAWSDALEETAEALAQELCDQCLPVEPFLSV